MASRESGSEYARATHTRNTPLGPCCCPRLLEEMLDIRGWLRLVQQLRFVSIGITIVDLLDMDILMHTVVVNIICAQSA